MTKIDALMEQLAAQGDRRTAAKAEAADATKEIAKLARQARKAGAMKVDICDAAQISRPALDTMLRD
jgi:hypothetical protein